VRIRVYGPLKQAVGTGDLSVEVPPKSALGEILQKMIVGYPEIGFKTPQEIEDKYLFCVGSRVANLHVLLADGGGVCLLPFVDGG